MKNFIIFLLIVACIGLLFRGCGRQGDSVTIVRDTVTVVRIDTVSHIEVKWRDRWRNIHRTDTLTHVERGDTIYVPIPIDTYVFTDDTTYRAEISGYGVTLDRMDVFRRTIDRTITVDRTILSPPKRFGIGIQAGYGVALSGIGASGGVRAIATPYIGIGISYNFIRF